MTKSSPQSQHQSAQSGQSHVATSKEAVRKPEPVKVEVNPSDSVAERRPYMRKVAVRKRFIHVEPRIIRLFVAEPLIVVDVRHVVHMAGGQMLCLALFGRIGSRRRSFWNVSLIRARPILCRPELPSLWRLATRFCAAAGGSKQESRGKNKNRCKHESQSGFHESFLSLIRSDLSILSFCSPTDQLFESPRLFHRVSQWSSTQSSICRNLVLGLERKANSPCDLSEYCHCS